ncbi:hypothetical protein PN498_26280 [Oscillatoria sp. CS-180]|uniref:hypothetical protein n=1 Tax=Oscillatoria sp. CS-180 TaxID=3021720 RepID=UPI00232D9976|nr:hypothetical protein [Oscillatoria sp. CS-180]MDB9529526.1 hypothetical protein [Oscillatoria sp. CS-180]
MEAFAVLFVLGIFFALTREYKKPKSKTAGEKLADGIGAVIKEVTGKEINPKKKKANDTDPLGVIIMAVLLGLLLTYIL